VPLSGPAQIYCTQWTSAGPVILMIISACNNNLNDNIRSKICCRQWTSARLIIITKTILIGIIRMILLLLLLSYLLSVLPLPQIANVQESYRVGAVAE
jgi:hypothetical protein